VTDAAVVAAALVAAGLVAAGLVAAELVAAAAVAVTVAGVVVAALGAPEEPHPAPTAAARPTATASAGSLRAVPAPGDMSDTISPGAGVAGVSARRGSGTTLAAI
jgi:hypothetical protein